MGAKGDIGTFFFLPSYPQWPSRSPLTIWFGRGSVKGFSTGTDAPRTGCFVAKAVGRAHRWRVFHDVSRVAQAVLHHLRQPNLEIQLRLSCLWISLCVDHFSDLALDVACESSMVPLSVRSLKQPNNEAWSQGATCRRTDSSTRGTPVGSGNHRHWWWDLISKK